MSVPALERGIAILRLFRRDRPRLTAPQIAAELALPRSTVHRLLVELEGLGLVRRDPEARFSLDVGVMLLGFEYLASQDFVTLAAPVLEALRDEINWSVHLAVLRGRSIVYLSRFASRESLTRNIVVGSTLPAHATLMGRLLLADLEPAALHALYDGVELERVNDNTPTSLAELQRLLDADRQLGHAASTGFFEAGVRTIAAPVRDASLRTVAAINATAVSADGAASLAATPSVCAAAERISRLLGAPAAAATQPMVGETKWR